MYLSPSVARTLVNKYVTAVVFGQKAKLGYLVKIELVIKLLQLS